MRPKAIITRPEEDAAALSALLEQRGVDSLIAPMLSITPVAGVDLDLQGVQGLLLTSANGARALAAATPRRDIPVFSVGEATAATARALGFRRVESAEGDVEALSALLVRMAHPGAGTLLHAAGSVTTGDLAGRLRDAGFSVRKVMLYEAHPAEALSPSVVAALREVGSDTAPEAPLRWVLFFSPRTAATFVRLVEAAGLATACRRLTALCLSENVASQAAEIEWQGIQIATRPEQGALVELLQFDASGPVQEDQIGKDAGSASMSDSTEDQPSEEEPAAGERDRVLEVIERFGGIRPMATKLGIAFTTVQGWKARGHIPPQRHEDILRAAAEHDIRLTAEDLAEAPEHKEAAPVDASDTGEEAAPAQPDWQQPAEAAEPGEETTPESQPAPEPEAPAYGASPSTPVYPLPTPAPAAGSSGLFSGAVAAVVVVSTLR